MKRFDRKGISTGAAVLLAVVVLAACFGLLMAGLATNWKFSFTPGPSIGGTGAVSGSFTIATFAYDTDDVSTNRTVGTDVSVTYYAKIGGSWHGLQPGLPNGALTTISLDGTEGGVIYAVCYTGAADTYYVDSAKTKQMNSRCSASGLPSISFETVYSNTKQWVFPFDMHNIPPNTRDTADVTFNVALLTYDSTFGFPSAGLGSNITGIGSSTKVSEYLTWYLSASLAKKGIAVRSIELKVNETDTTQFAFIKQNIPEVGYIDGQAFTPYPQATQILYSYTIGTDLGSCAYWNLQAGVNNKFDVTTAIDVTISAATTHVWTITIHELKPTGNGVSDTATLWIAY